MDAYVKKKAHVRPTRKKPKKKDEQQMTDGKGLCTTTIWKR